MDRRSNPVVSIIVPARNEEACLSSCLESLVAQTGIDFEIIVVDDASTDRTAEIARSLASREVMSGDATGKGTTFSRAENYSNTIDGTAESRALTKAEAPHGEDPSASLWAGARSSAAHVEADARVRPDIHVIPAPPLPEGWTGKNNAMAAGAKLAKGKWLLFTDADTFHKPGSLARAVAEADHHRAALLSYSPEQEVHSFWEKAVMPVIFAELAATYPPAKVNDPASPIAAANGQYVLISREAYDAVGGHTKIASDLLEDVAMARLVKSSGRKVFFRYGGDAVRTRMYRSFAEMKEGWTKNLGLLFPNPRALAFFRATEFALIIGNLIAAIVSWSIGRSDVAFATSVLGLLVAGSCLTRIRRAHFSASSNLLSLLGMPMFSYLLFRSAKLHRENRVSWKGRRYGMGSENPEHPRQENPTTHDLGLARTTRRSI